LMERNSNVNTTTVTTRMLPFVKAPIHAHVPRKLFFT